MMEKQGMGKKIVRGKKRKEKRESSLEACGDENRLGTTGRKTELWDNARYYLQRSLAVSREQFKKPWVKQIFFFFLFSEDAN